MSDSSPSSAPKCRSKFEINLNDERDARRQYNEAARICAAEGDDGSRALFERMILDEERHVDYLEAQLHAIGEMGIANYLAQKMESK